MTWLLRLEAFGFIGFRAFTAVGCRALWFRALGLGGFGLGV